VGVFFLNTVYVRVQDVYTRHQKDMEALQFRLSKLQQEFEAQLNVCDQLNTENQNRALELKVFIYTRCPLK